MRKILLVVGALVVVGLLVYSFSSSPSVASAETDAAYAAQVHQARQQKDQAFRTAPTSPIPAEQRAAFREALAPAYEEYADEYGADTIDRIIATE